MTDVDQFMWQSWNSRRPAVTEAELYKQIISFIGGSAQAHLQYLEELEFDSIAYQYFDDIGLVIDKSAVGAKSALAIPAVSYTHLHDDVWAVCLLRNRTLPLQPRGEQLEACLLYTSRCV